MSSGRLTQPASPQSNWSRTMSPCVMNLPLMLLSWIGMDLKRLMFSVMATSVGRRSMLEAPKKPTMPVVRSRT